MNLKSPLGAEAELACSDSPCWLSSSCPCSPTGHHPERPVRLPQAVLAFFKSSCLSCPCMPTGHHPALQQGSAHPGSGVADDANGWLGQDLRARPHCRWAGGAGEGVTRWLRICDVAPPPWPHDHVSMAIVVSISLWVTSQNVLCETCNVWHVTCTF